MRYHPNVMKKVVMSIKDQKKNTQTTEKPERVYYLWFHFLKLLLELEEKKIPLIVGKKRKKIYVGKDLKIDRNYYREWDLEDVLENTWGRWRNTHLRIFENPSTEFSEKVLGSWKPSPHFRFVRMDLRNDPTSIMRDVRKELESLKGVQKSIKSELGNQTNKFKVFGEPQYDNLILKYNIMVRIINEEEDLEILDGERQRFKDIEKSHKGSELEYEKESELWTLEKQWRKFSPEELKGIEKRVIDSKTHYDTRMVEQMGGLSKQIKTKTEVRISPGGVSERNFKNRLRMELSRHTKETQWILNGVSKGMFLKKVKFE